ncbi:DUF421 domain-containing protein [Curtobacterium sp. ISL-83]|uniref:DUF421 domain-containing protein n=1 Tax=Curtobacterium sp. ISL-83 TaxID=2819145 RepID=UPI001BED1ED3|nr:YetF domain-containing protein [Curtobacterium sp. ISL-83]MBT2502868.1 DUF421 domain-containing protein [Curtobacterium sp. ISL-83]
MFLVLVRIFGQRPLARMSTSDVVVVLALGSIAGRVVLGLSVTLTAGAIALATLFVLRWVVERIGRSSWGRRLVTTQPVLLMADGAVQHDLLARSRVSVEELQGVLRSAGIRNTQEVACVVLESTGTVSVVRTGTPLDQTLYAGIIGADRIPSALFRS